MRWLACALVFVLVGSSCAIRVAFVPARIVLSTPSPRIPLELVNNMPFVRVRIAGGPSMAAVVDTGADLVMLTPRVATLLHLTTSPLTSELDGTDGKRERTVPLALVEQLELDGVRTSRLGALVLPELERVGQTMGVPLDVLLGGSLFRDQLVTIDYERRALGLEAGELPAPDDHDVVVAQFASGVPVIPISVEGIPVEVIVDSGCSSWLALPAALEAKLPLKRAAIAGAKHMSLNGEARDRVARLAGRVRIGSHVLVDPPVDFTPGQPRVCAQLLRYFAVTIDARHGRARFTRADVAPILVPAERTAGLGLLKQNGSWVIADLIPGLAPAGIELGDVIVAIDDRSADALTRSDLRALQEAAQLHVELRRADRTFAIDVPVRAIGD